MTLGQTGRRAAKDGRLWDRPTPVGAGRAPNANTGSRGGAPIWVMREAWMPEDIERKRHKEGGRWGPPTTPRDGLAALHRLSRNTGEQNARAQRGGFDPERLAADPDGFAIFGRFPKGWLRHVLKLRLLGDVRRDEVLHICSGTLSESERWTVDIRTEARPRVQASGTALPFRDGSFRAILLDPPYSDEYAKNLYGVENPRPSWLLREAARVVTPGGRIGILHVAVPFAPTGCRLVNVYGITTGGGFRIRALTLYSKDEAQLFETKGTS